MDWKIGLLFLFLVLTGFACGIAILAASFVEGYTRTKMLKELKENNYDLFVSTFEGRSHSYMEKLILGNTPRSWRDGRLFSEALKNGRFDGYVNSDLIVRNIKVEKLIGKLTKGFLICWALGMLTYFVSVE